MYFCSANAQNVANIPPDSITGAFSLLVEYSGAYGNGCKQTFTEHNPGITYIRRMSDISAGHWSAWEPIATATPPQEFSLPLAAGIDAYGKSTYCKTQEGICFVNIAAHSSSDGIMDQSIIATLPAGFRPDMVTYAAGHGFTNAGTRIPLDVEVNPDGTIQIWAASVLEYCSCFVGFVAAS